MTNTEYLVDWTGVKGIYIRAFLNKSGDILGWGIFEGQNFILSKNSKKFTCMPIDKVEEFYKEFTFNTAEEAMSFYKL